MTLEQLFDDHHASLFRFVSRMTGDPDYAKDIVQETFIAIAAKPVPADVPPRAWLFGVAHNLAHSGLRTGRRRSRLLDVAPHRLAAPASPAAPDEGAERAELRAAVRAALAELTEKERTMLLMREEGFRHREIAAALGTTTGSVGTMLARALTKLEDRLGTVWAEP
jgi:RNA polymerase sigma factor (sigma-70 family)